MTGGWGKTEIKAEEIDYGSRKGWRKKTGVLTENKRSSETQH